MTDEPAAKRPRTGPAGTRPLTTKQVHQAVRFLKDCGSEALADGVCDNIQASSAQLEASLAGVAYPWKVQRRDGCEVVQLLPNDKVLDVLLDWGPAPAETRLLAEGEALTADEVEVVLNMLRQSPGELPVHHVCQHAGVKPKLLRGEKLPWVLHTGPDGSTKLRLRELDGQQPELQWRQEQQQLQHQLQQQQQQQDWQWQWQQQAAWKGGSKGAVGPSPAHGVQQYWACQRCQIFNPASTLTCPQCGASCNAEIAANFGTAARMPAEDRGSPEHQAMVQQFLSNNTIQPHAVQQFMQLTPQQQQNVMERGSLHDARDPTAVLISRIAKSDATVERRAGDWNCPTCGDFQFQRNIVCRSCGTPNANPVPPKPAPSPNAFSYKRKMCMHYLKGQCTRGEMCTFAHGDEEIQMAKMAVQFQTAVPPDMSNQAPEVQAFLLNNRIQPHAASQFLQLSPAEQRNVMDRGSLHDARDPTAVLITRMTRRALETEIRKPGDWNCPNCNDWQFARNVTCRHCGCANPSPQAPPAHHPPGQLKTKMCSFFLEGRCTRADLCTFAHSEAELEPRGRHGQQSTKGLATRGPFSPWSNGWC